MVFERMLAVGDAGDFWADVKPWMLERSKQKRASNREFAASKLLELGIRFESKNGGAHLIVGDSREWNFWPGTGLWTSRLVSGVRGRGIESFLRAVRKSKD